jgi:hypothetical protein
LGNKRYFNGDELSSKDEKMFIELRKNEQEI